MLLSVLPVGLLQARASLEYGTWYARSSEFLQTGLINDLRWLRVIGDSIFAFGAVVLGWFMLGLVVGYSYDRTAEVREGEFVTHPVAVK
jgi:nitric oxide reductase subunit B